MIHSGEVISKDELFDKVSEAAEEIGIGPVKTVLTERSKGWQNILGSHAVREVDQKTDLGFFRPTDGTYTTGSFHYNPNAFSDQRAERFIQALRNQGLETQPYNPLSTLHYNEADFAAAAEPPAYQ